MISILYNEFQCFHNIDRLTISRMQLNYTHKNRAPGPGQWCLQLKISRQCSLYANILCVKGFQRLSLARCKMSGLQVDIKRGSDAECPQFSKCESMVKHSILPLAGDLPLLLTVFSPITFFSTSEETTPDVTLDPRSTCFFN